LGNMEDGKCSNDLGFKELFINSAQKGSS